MSVGRIVIKAADVIVGAHSARGGMEAHYRRQTATKAVTAVAFILGFVGVAESLTSFIQKRGPRIKGLTAASVSLLVTAAAVAPRATTPIRRRRYPGHDR